MVKENTLPRRNFIRICTRITLYLAGVLGLGGVVRYFSFRPDPGPPTSFDLGNARDFPPGSRIFRPDIPAVVLNRGGKFSAFSLSCTHLGCALKETGDGFSCPCHGSQFDAEGIVLKGPAEENLRQLRVELDKDQSLMLFTKGAEK